MAPETRVRPYRARGDCRRQRRCLVARAKHDVLCDGRAARPEAARRLVQVPLRGPHEDRARRP